jgi:superfamily I DNA/RNA helicase
LRRADLRTNYRCPPPVVERAVRLVEHNLERFAKRIEVGPANRGRLVLAPDASDDVVRLVRAMSTWPVDDSGRAVLARTNRELLAAVVAAVELGVPFRAPDLPLVIEDPRIDGLLDRAEALVRDERPGCQTSSLLALGRLRAEILTEPGAMEDEAAAAAAAGDGPTQADLLTALLGWSAGVPSLDGLRAAVTERREQLARLRRDDAALTLATAHGTKGQEWDHVIVCADGFPGLRSTRDATEPERALEEERRLAYVAWTRARRSLTLLYDPAAPSPFLREAFDPDELGLEDTTAA